MYYPHMGVYIFLMPTPITFQHHAEDFEARSQQYLNSFLHTGNHICFSSVVSYLSQTCMTLSFKGEFAVVPTDKIEGGAYHQKFPLI